MNTENVIVKASFRGCPLSDRKQFYKSSCLMPISVGQKVHEGEKFLATIKLINSHFGACTLLVDDSIQRFTLQISDPSLTLEEAYVKAVRLGVEWLKRNEHIYEQLTIPYEIKRWDDWRLMAEYVSSREKIEGMYRNDLAYKEAIHASIEEFIARYLPRLDSSIADKDLAFKNCLEYMKEECAVMCLWVINRYSFEVYSGDRNKAMVATHEKFIKPFYSDVLRSVALRFKKYQKKSF